MFPKLVLLCTFILVCHGTIWKLDDGTMVIDDLTDEATPLTPTDGGKICHDSSGAEGRCVPIQECNLFHDFKEEAHYLTEAMARYVNESSFESCSPSSPDSEGTTIDPGTSGDNFVCCTSVRYVSAKEISSEEYMSRYPATNESSEIQFASNTEVFKPLIVAGEPALQGEFPFAVALIEGRRQFCGGSLIGSQWVLSAAHCFDKFSSSRVRDLVVKIGDHDLYTTAETHQQDRAVKRLFLHPGFFRGPTFFRDDVAVLELKTPVNPASNIRTIALHSGSPDLHNPRGADAIVCGWGMTCAQKGCPLSRTLRKARVSIISTASCNQRYAGTAAPSITPNMVCALGSSQADACNGDSGGPLFVNAGSQIQQVGIVSWGIGCGSYPGVYTRVSSFGEWIRRYATTP